MKKLNPKVFRVYDDVIIKNPEFVVRVGYPFGINYAKENLVTQEEKDLLIKLCGFRNGGLFIEKNTYQENCYNNMLKELAYNRLKKIGFGGSERTIHTKYIKELKDKRARIWGKRLAKTGKRDYYWEGSWETEEYGVPYLANEKTHIILSLSPYNYSDDIKVFEFLEIESKNLVKFVENY